MNHRLLQLNLAIIVSGMLLFTYWVFLDGFFFPPYTFTTDPLALKTDKTVYHPGDTVSVYADFCKTRNASSVVSWSLIDTIVRTYPTKATNIPLGCHKGWFTIVEIPIGVPLDTYHLEGVAVVSINPAANVTYHYKSLDFTVKPNN